jgi:hypothetical protein
MMNGECKTNCITVRVNADEFRPIDAVIILSTGMDTLGVAPQISM